MHWGKTEFPDGVYDPLSFMATRLDTPARNFANYVPDWAEFTEARFDRIEDASPGPKGEATVRIAGEACVNKVWLIEAMNGYLGNVWYAPYRVAGVSTFGHFMIAQISSR